MRQVRGGERFERRRCSCRWRQQRCKRSCCMRCRCALPFGGAHGWRGGGGGASVEGGRAIAAGVGKVVTTMTTKARATER